MAKMYRTSQVAALLGVTTSTVNRWIKAGKVKAMRTEGGHHRITEAEVDRLKQKAIDPWRI